MNAPEKRGVALPPGGSPYWLPSGLQEASAPLLYLGWGRRRYGAHPVPARLHAGWTYTVIKEGSPVLHMGRRSLRVEAGSFVVVGPDARTGWSDAGDSQCEVLVWLWAGAPQFASARGLTPDGYWMRRASRELLEQADRWHEETRREIRRSDEHVHAACVAIQQLMDVVFARAEQAPVAADARDEQRVRLALEWMRQHIDGRASVRDLADYLGLSSMTLHRLFTRCNGAAPGKTFHRIKMEEATRRLQSTEESIKSIGLGLGYRNPGDFTRAFTRYFGCPPGAVRNAVHET